MGLGLLVTAVSGAALALATAGATEATLHARLGFVLTGLAIGWYVISRGLSSNNPRRAVAASRVGNERIADSGLRAGRRLPPP